jgi:voltage-gated potassium channel
VQASVRLDPRISQILDYADLAVCAVFLVDFALSLWRAPDRRRYFLTWGWLDLLSSLPALDAARWGRAARILRVLRVLRGLRATRLLAGALLRQRAESAFLAASLAALLLVVFCSVAVLLLETHPDSNIRTAEDAVWWAFTTVTTVGYGDRYPVTTEGRLIAIVLMCAGVGLFGTFSGFLAAWLVGGEASRTSEMEALRIEIAALRERLGAGGGPGGTASPPGSGGAP